MIVYAWVCSVINIRIILMSNQNNYEDECFVATTVEQYHTQDQTQHQSYLNQYLRNSLPQANQLKPYYRPTQMNARVMSLQPELTKLPSILNEECEQLTVNPSQINSILRPKLNNKDKLTLAQYLSKKEFYVTFMKRISIASKSISEMTIRLRQVSQVSDYNCKAFKQLGEYQEKTEKGERQEESVDSNFQCGNLARAYCSQNQENAYYLLLQQDTNTHGYTNWFFFRFRNKQKCTKKFYIMNMVKRTSFYKQGMKISVFSMKKWQQNRTKWHKTGQNISFFQTNFIRQQHNSDYYNCLYFQYQFEYQNDQVYFAASQPYTYTRMSTFLKSLTSPSPSPYPCSTISKKCQTIGYSVANNIIPSITFSSSQNQPNCEPKKTILILGRQHPSEMAGSFIAESFIRIFDQYQDNQEVLFLLKRFNVMVVPMVNPDGVIYGNSRSNLSGFDLNRHWGSDAIKELTPQTHKIRSLLCQLQKNNNNITFLLDLHGHGKKINSFLFCCRKQDRISNRYFPLIMSKIQQRFDIVSCTYGISRDKENTVRAQLYDIGIRDCYTLQNSYYGYNKNKQGFDIVSYKESDYEAIARSIIKSLYVFFASQKNQKQAVKQKIGWNLDTVNQELVKIVDKLQREEKNLANDQDIMSESDPEGDGLKLQERLNMYNNSKTLGKKIRESFKKNKSLDRNGKNSKKSRQGEKNQKVKTQMMEYQKEQDDEAEDTRALEKKIEGKLVLSKKLKTHNKIKTSIRERKSMLETKRPEDDETKLVKKMFSKPFNPFKVPSQPPSQKMSSSLYTHNSSSSGFKTKPFEKCKIYEKLKTEIIENHSFSAMDIQAQNERKEKIESQLSKLKQENLKNVVKESLLFMGSSLKSKKCRWVDDRKQKNMASNHLIEAKINSFSVNLENIQQDSALTSQKSEALIGKTQKIIRAPVSDSFQMKVYSESKRKKPKRSYHRFESFVKNTPSINKLLSQNKGPVFYHFPVM